MAIERVIKAKGHDLGELTVRRILPHETRRMVGPFAFFDHMGPAEFKPGEGISVRPHPHINLATVTYLFEGAIQHRDSLGMNQVIEPGAINWMVAGAGIVHSERVPEHLRDKNHRLNGIQVWIALPEEQEEISPSFSHHAKETLPEFTVDQVKLKLLLGKAYGKTSPVSVHSPLCYLEAFVPQGQSLHLPDEYQDIAAYVVDGDVEVDGEAVSPHSMMVAKPASGMTVTARSDAHLVVFGGDSVGTRHIFWNFVSSSKERIEEAKLQWQEGPYLRDGRFSPIPGDDAEFIPLPASGPTPPKGTIL